MSVYFHTGISLCDWLNYNIQHISENLGNGRKWIAVFGRVTTGCFWRAQKSILYQSNSPPDHYLVWWLGFETCWLSSVAPFRAHLAPVLSRSLLDWPISVPCCFNYLFCPNLSCWLTLTDQTSPAREASHFLCHAFKENVQNVRLVLRFSDGLSWLMGSCLETDPR